MVPDEVLVKTSKRSYTVNDYEDLFKDIGYPLGIKLRKMVENLLNPLSAHAPKVQLHCLYGTGVHTAASFVYEKGEFPDHQPEIIYGDGDGTVNRRSLEAWRPVTCAKTGRIKALFLRNFTEWTTLKF